MARAESVPRSEYPAILRSSEVDKQKTSAIAARYGVVPRTIAIILAKARADAGGSAPAAVADIAAEAPAALIGADVPSGGARPVSYEGVPTAEMPATLMPAPVPVIEPVIELAVAPLTVKPAAPAVIRPPASPRDIRVSTRPAKTGKLDDDADTDLDEAPMQARGKGSVSNAKAAYGLVTKTDDGDENVMPFKSLEDLLQTAKQLMRTAAKAPEPVWFSIKEVDLQNYEA